jgi:hypothetical protein
MMEIVSFIGRYYFVLGLLAFILCFIGACASIALGRRSAQVQDRRKETVLARREIAQYRAYVRYVGDLTMQNQAALHRRSASYGGLKKVA